jgi:hypothetical protein
MLTEVLAIVNPRAYGRSLRTQQLVAHIVKELKITNGWQYEMAAALSQLGWITFSQQMLQKIEDNQSFNASEAVIFSNHPFTASKLLKNIPRLELVARVILGQDRSIDDLCLDPAFPEAYAVDLGSHILKVCIDYDHFVLEGLQHDQAMARLKARQNCYLPEILNILDSLHSYKPIPEGWHGRNISLKDLEVGMLIVEPVKDITGKILIKGNTYLTRSDLINLLGLGTGTNTVVEPLKVALRDKQG